MEPKILSQNTFYWRPGDTALQRRTNEKRRLAEVKTFLLSLNFEITKETLETIKAVHDNLEVEFYYSESCRNVYKRFSVKKDGKKSNITALRKLYNEKKWTVKIFNNKKEEIDILFYDLDPYEKMPALCKQYNCESWWSVGNNEICLFLEDKPVKPQIIYNSEGKIIKWLCPVCSSEIIQKDLHDFECPKCKIKIES